MRPIAGYSSLDHRGNEDILEEVTAKPVEKKLAQYKQNLLNLLSMMEDIRYPKQVLGYKNLSGEVDLDDR
jgi:hypothetical protein